MTAEFIGYHLESGEDIIVYFTVEQNDWYAVFWMADVKEMVLADNEYFDSLSNGFFEVKEINLKKLINF